METVSAVRFKSCFMCCIDLLLLLGAVGQALHLTHMGFWALSLQSLTVGCGGGVGYISTTQGGHPKKPKGAESQGRSQWGPWGVPVEVGSQGRASGL